MPEAICAAYGLAEATVFVPADRIDRPPRITRFDRNQLAAGEAIEAAASETGSATTALVSCGVPAGQRIAIVAPETSQELPDGRVGEIRVCGPNVSRRYWQQPER